MNDEAVFSGLKVLDIASYIAAPAAAAVLGDLGADVIKVEPPGLGDLQRSWAARRRTLVLRPTTPGI